jgi:putative ABC transport system permease protein
VQDWKAYIRQSLPPLAEDPVREADIVEELAQHMAERYREALSVGASEADAFQAAAGELVERDGLAREIRDAERQRTARILLAEPPARPWLALFQDVRFALRLLRRSPGFTVTALATLALGIGANTTMFTLVSAALLRPLPYHDPGRLAVIGSADTEEIGPVGYATVRDWERRSRSFDEVSMISLWTPTLLADGAPERLVGLKVSWQYFRMLGVAPAIGRDFREDEDRPEQWRVVILGDRLWRRRFGADPRIVGRSIPMNGRRYTVVGVLPRDFEPLISARFYQAAEIWAPLGYDESLAYACRSCQHLRVIARLRAGVSARQAGVDLNAIQRSLRAEHPTEYGPEAMTVEPLADVVAGSARRPLAILMVAVGLVLLAACANVANLLLARSSGRARELAVRSALGAGRGRLIRQMLSESLVLAAGGAAGGLLLAHWGVTTLARLAPVSIPRLGRAALDPQVLGFTLVLTLVTGVLFGLVPAWRATSIDLRSALAIDGRSAAGSRSARTRRLLVAAELAVGFVLLAGAGLMLKSVGRLLSVDPGFDPRGVVTARLEFGGTAHVTDAQVVAASEAVLDQVGSLPGVEAAAFASQIPLSGNVDRYGVHIEGRIPANPEEDPSLERYGVTADYFKVMRIPLRQGRYLDPADRAGGASVMLINETASRALFPGESPIGKRVRVGDATAGPWRTIVGVVGDVRHQDLAHAPTMQMYLPESQFTDSSLSLVVRAGAVSGLAAALSGAVWRSAAGVPVYGMTTVDDMVRSSVGRQRFLMLLLGLFAAAAVTLAAIGVYGVAACAVSERTREIGLRLALGANARQIFGMVMGGGVVAVTSGLALGVVGAVAAGRSLEGLLFGVSAADPATLSLVALGLAVVALLGHWLPARRAVRVDPLIALREG